MAAIGLISSCKKEVKANKVFIEEVSKYYTQQTSISADVDYSIKYFDNDDTTKVKTQIKLIRDKKDTIFGGIVWYKADIDSTYINVEKYYDRDKLYLIEKDSLLVTRYNTKKGETFAIDGATDGEAKNIFFFEPEKLTKVLKDTLVKSTITDTVFNNKDYVLLALSFPDDDEFKGRIKKIYINKENKLIEKITYYCKYANQFQYKEWNISNIEFNMVKKEELDKHFKEVTAKYKVTDYKEPTEEEMAPLALGTKAPDFEAKLFTAGKTVKLSDYKGKIVVLDFWYMACYPCCQSIPHLNAIQQKHKDVVVLGVNPYDTDKKKIVKVPDFIKQHKVGYLIAGIDNNVVKQYNVYGFPTVYIIDKNGMIQFAVPGFSEEMEKILDEKITALK